MSQQVSSENQIATPQTGSNRKLDYCILSFIISTSVAQVFSDAFLTRLIHSEIAKGLDVVSFLQP